MSCDPHAPEHIRPAIVLPGFPKCGSTSLYDWLVTHPAIVGPVTKEPQFFTEIDYQCKRDEIGLPTYRRDGIEAYGALWPDAQVGSLRLDATPFYVFYPTARAVLHEDEVAPLSVIVVRQPSARVHSLYRALQSRAGRLSKHVDFAEFVARVRRGDSDLVADDIQVRDCIVHSDYRRWIEPWREAAGPDRVLVYTTERLRDDPHEVLAEIASALGIDPTGFALELSASNVTESARSTTLARLRRMAGRRRLLRNDAVKRVAKRLYEQVNLSDRRRPTTPAERNAMASIDDELRDSISWLSSELGLDTSAWLAET